MATAAALTIAGSDSGGGAGIQADLKTFSALGVYGTCAITLVTAQNTRGVQRVEPVSPQMVAAQIASVLDDIEVGAVKIGALGSAEIISAVTGALADFRGPVVLDPVMIAKSGDLLLGPGSLSALNEQLLPKVDLVTPNLAEAAAMTRTAVAEGTDQMAIQAGLLMARGARAALIKGGHGSGDEATDLLALPDTPPRILSARRIATRNTHGTGCTLSAAIAACLAQGMAMGDAAVAAKGWLTDALIAADLFPVGSGHGPVHHFHALWPRRD